MWADHGCELRGPFAECEANAHLVVHRIATQGRLAEVRPLLPKPMCIPSLDMGTVEMVRRQEAVHNSQIPSFAVPAH